MKKVMIVIFLCSMCLVTSSCAQQKTEDNVVTEEVHEETTNSTMIFSGTKEEVEAGKKMYEAGKKIIDPAFDIVLLAERYYDKGDYEAALKETNKALKMSKSPIVDRAAHRNLLDIYKATEKYDLAIGEIDWLLDNVNEHAKPELLKKKEELQKLLSEQEK